LNRLKHPSDERALFDEQALFLEVVHSQYGWGRFDAKLGDAAGPGRLRPAPSLKGRFIALPIHERHLRTSETVGNFRAAFVNCR